MEAQQDEETIPEMGRGLKIALRTVQGGLLAYAGYRLLRIYQIEQGIFAFVWSIPWFIAVLLIILLVPALVRLGWRRFGRPGPTWAIATIIVSMSWVVVTMLCWMVLGLVLILSD